MSLRIALLEDDPIQADLLATWLTQAGHAPHHYSTASDLIQAIVRESFDLYIIDWVLPDMSGYDVLRWLREERRDTAPVIFATSRDAEDDIAAALRCGADDYLVKPVRRLELLSRIEAIWRRIHPLATSSEVIELPPYRFELAIHRVFIDGRAIDDLTEKEFQLAVFLFRNFGRLLSRGHLLEAIWGMRADIPTRTLDTHISRVRRKLDIQPGRGLRLAPTYNFGYRLEKFLAPVSTEA
jgi:two-component system, OmpR family, response regulator RegX3